MGKLIQVNKNEKDRLAQWQLLQLHVFERRIVEAVVFLRGQKVEPILIKGWAAAQNYPRPEERSYTDIDLVVSPENYNAALDCLKSFTDKISIDLHKGARHLDRLAYENLYENSRLVKCGDALIRVLRPEDHLRILCVHWLNDGGAKKEKLRDIYYAVANRPTDFDWDRCLNSVGSTRKRWIVCAIGLAQKYLNLDLTNTPFENEPIEIPEWLIKALEREWASGVLLLPLEHCLNDKKELLRQIKKRIPPNPIQATIELEGEFDNKPRVFYQIGDIFFRLQPPIKRIAKTIFGFHI